MRLFVSLSALLISATLLVVYSNSFTTAEVKNETTLRISAEGNALIAITYEKAEKLTIKNNTDKTITIKSVSIINDSNHKITTQGKESPVSLNSTGSQVYNITGKPSELPGKVIVVKADWNGGSAEVKSTIPNLQENQKTSDPIVEQIDTELDSENIIPESIEEQSDPEVDRELEEGEGK